MAIEPFAHLRVFMGRIVVEDDMDRFFGWDLSLDLVEKADELLMPMLLHAASDDLAFEHVEGGKQGSGAVAFVVVRHSGGAPLLEGQARLGYVGLDWRNSSSLSRLRCSALLLLATRCVGVRLADTRRVDIRASGAAERRIPEAIAAASERHVLTLRECVKAAL
jgi:hypothetical protein